MRISVSNEESGRRRGGLLPAAEGVQVVLWRHGQSIANVARLFQGHGDGPLSPLGLDQARRSADLLVGLAPARIVSSDLRRAQDTAAQLGARTGLPVRVDRRLREANLGRWEGRSRADIAGRFPDEYARWGRGEDIARGGGERPSEVAARALASLTDHIDDLPAEATLVAASHAGTILAIAGSLLGLTVPQWREQPPVVNAAFLRFQTTSTGWEQLNPE